MRTFLGGPSTPGPSTVTLLFSDIVSSTEMLQLLGDTAAADILREHMALLAGAVANHGGTLVKRLGDGVLASFVSASAAVRCALVAREQLRARNDAAPTSLHLRIGLAAGEPIPDGDDLLGTVVHLAARLCAAAQPDEILVTDAVHQLVSGQGFHVGDARAVTLKGFPQPVAVRPVLDRHG
jgi:class 3 adenylate cyclase